MNEIKTWLGQVTTGHGFMILGPTLLAVLSGTMTWQTAVPLLVAGAVGLLWPENTKLSATVQTIAADVIKLEPGVATDVKAVQDAYLTGVAHGNAAATPASVTTTATAATTEKTS